MSDVSMLGSGMKNWILGDSNGIIVIIVDRKILDCDIVVTQLLLHSKYLCTTAATAIYFVSDMDVAVNVYFLLN